jgi:3-isopropylmalate dehydrogenase
MASSNSIRVGVLPGDGIGIEVMQPCLACLDAVAAQAGSFSLSYETLEAGAGVFRDTGTALPDDVVKRAGNADVMLLGAMGLPDVRYPDGREITPQIELREIFDLYAGVRPVETFPGSPVPLKDPRAASLDFVLVRENTEGLFHSRLTPQLTGDEEARETLADHAACNRTACRFRVPAGRTAQGTRPWRGPGHLRRQGQCLCQLRLHAQGVLRARCRVS